MLRLYDTRLSGNAWKVRILLRQLGIPFERVTMDLATGDHAKPEFRKKAKFARIPVLEFDDGRTLVESPAILTYLADGTPFLPDDKFLRAEVAAWLFFEQSDLLKAIAYPRVWTLRGLTREKAQQIADFREFAYPALQKVEDWLATHEWLVADRYTIADINMFAYVAMAHEGGYAMDRFPAIAAWIARVKEQPGWVPLIEEA